MATDRVDTRLCFVIVIDTRERWPYPFKGHLTIRNTLPYGDYSIQGFENQITIERKTLNDLLVCFGKERNRFMAEMEGLARYKTKALIVESTYNSVLHHRQFSKLHRNSAKGSVAKLIADYCIPVLFVGSRAFGEELILSIFKQAMENLRMENLKKEK